MSLVQKLILFQNSSIIRLSIQQNATYRTIMTPLSRSPVKPHMRRVFEEVEKPILPEDPEFVNKIPLWVRCRRPEIDRERLERKTQVRLKKFFHKFLLLIRGLLISLTVID